MHDTTRAEFIDVQAPAPWSKVQAPEWCLLYMHTLNQWTFWLMKTTVNSTILVSACRVNPSILHLTTSSNVSCFASQADMSDNDKVVFDLAEFMRFTNWANKRSFPCHHCLGIVCALFLFLVFWPFWTPKSWHAPCFPCIRRMEIRKCVLYFYS